MAVYVGPPAPSHLASHFREMVKQRDENLRKFISDIPNRFNKIGGELPAGVQNEEFRGKTRTRGKEPRQNQGRKAQKTAPPKIKER